MAVDEMTPDTEPLYAKIKTLNEFLWEGRTPRSAVNEWLDNFRGERESEPLERAHALYLLSKFLYFGEKEVRALLSAMFHDLIRNPLTVEVRRAMSNCTDFNAIHQAFIDELDRTRFAALGGPSESGTHILYEFRQENELTTELFPNLGDLVNGPLDHADTKWLYPEVDRLVFIDDFCGTGQQIIGMGCETLPDLRRAADKIGVKLDIWYLTLVATTKGLANVEQTGLFQRVRSLSVLDDTYRVFSPDSQYFSNPPDYIDKTQCEDIITYYGNLICPGASLGYGDCQLLLGFRHNVPDNTLPMIWLEHSSPWWRPIFQRSHKFSLQSSTP